MGRPRRGSKKETKAESTPATKIAQLKPVSEATEVIAVSVLESPLFLCRYCRDSFETSEVTIFVISIMVYIKVYF